MEKEIFADIRRKNAASELMSEGDVLCRKLLIFKDIVHGGDKKSVSEFSNIIFRDLEHIEEIVCSVVQSLYPNDTP